MKNGIGHIWPIPLTCILSRLPASAAGVQGALVDPADQSVGIHRKMFGPKMSGGWIEALKVYAHIGIAFARELYESMVEQRRIDPGSSLVRETVGPDDVFHIGAMGDERLRLVRQLEKR